MASWESHRVPTGNREILCVQSIDDLGKLLQDPLGRLERIVEATFTDEVDHAVAEVFQAVNLRQPSGKCLATLPTPGFV